MPQIHVTLSLGPS